MNIFKRIKGKSRAAKWHKNAPLYREEQRKKLTDKDFTLLSQNCWGGLLYHDLGQKFLSPTINMFFVLEDFIKFCERLDHYLSAEPTISDKSLEWHLKEKGVPSDNVDKVYPVLLLEDLTLFMVHYETGKEAKEKWIERAKRVNEDNIVVLCTDRDGFNEDLSERFEKLPYKKVMFVHDREQVTENKFYLEGYEDQKSVGLITDEYGTNGRRVYDKLDCVEFLNSGRKIRNENFK